KEYHVTKGAEGSKVLYFTANANAEAEVVQVYLRPAPRLKKAKFDYDFADLAIKGRGAGGNTLSKYLVRKIELKEKGVSTLGARKIWFDPAVTRLNIEGRGNFLGEFQPADKILVILNTGEYKLIGFDLSTHFDDAMIHLEKWIPLKPVSVVHYDGEKEQFYAKRFLAEKSTKKVLFISEHENSRLEAVSTAFYPIANLRFNKKFKITRDKDDEQIKLDEFISIKGIKAIGNKLHNLPVTEVSMLDPDEEKEAEALAALQPNKNTNSDSDSDDDDSEEDDGDNGSDDSGPDTDGDDSPEGDSASKDTSAPLSVQISDIDDTKASIEDSTKPMTIAEKKAARKKAGGDKPAISAPKAKVSASELDENGEPLKPTAPDDKTINTQEFADVMAEAKARKEAKEAPKKKAAKKTSVKNTSTKLSDLKAPNKAAAKKEDKSSSAKASDDKPLRQNPDDIEMDIDIPDDEDSLGGVDDKGQASLF
ncbi:MAG: hypothetical protein AB8B53_06900, partial [Flavobacteriales bacterium]